ncbi:MAG: desulfoferrodoxin [Candidatus Krumholzibacteria bacterium]|nr:desulfoferrodoxin [Candidatus Krumholzibacteria bacterium]
MAKRLEIYKCDVCGNIVEVLHGGAGKLVCCGQEMKVFEAKTADQSTEKHVPVIEKVDGGYKVVVGSTPHPMEEKHWIEWIQLISGDTSCRAFLKPGDKPEAFFKCDLKNVWAREYCNVHGLWKKE